MPGGVSVALLILQAANAVTGAAAAIDDIRDAGMKKDMAYSQFAITDEQMQLVKECNVNVTDFNYLVAVISGLFSIADFADCARILKELGYFDDITKTLLRNGKNVSAKLLKNLPKEDVQKLAHACEKINPELFNRVAELPENEVSKLLASSDLDELLLQLNDIPVNTKVNIDYIINIVNNSWFKKGYTKESVLQEIKQAKLEGKKFLPPEYLSQTFIKTHIQAFKDEGVSYLLPKEILDKYGREILGRPDGNQFVMKASEMTNLLEKAAGNVSYIEKELGIPAGAWQGKELVRIDIIDVELVNVRMATGFEDGANDLWIPGGYLPTGYAEAVTDNILIGNFKETVVPIKKLSNIESPTILSFSSWEDMKSAFPGRITEFLKENKPKGAPVPSKWFAHNGEIKLQNIKYNDYIWKYKMNDYSVSYVGNEIQFPKEYLHPVDFLSNISLGTYTGNRKKDYNEVLKYIKNLGFDSVPKGYVVHHCNTNGHYQLVKKDVHRLFSHYGGFYYNK